MHPSRQIIMITIGAELTLVTPGTVEIEMPYSRALTQQHGFLHAGIISTALDSACGYSAFSAPGKGERFVFRGSVIKPGRTITLMSVVGRRGLAG